MTGVEGTPMSVTPMPKPDAVPTIGLDDLTAAELAIAERKAAQSITTLGNPQFPQASLLGALGWVLARRTDARLTFDAYMSSRKLAEITRELGLSTNDDDDDPDAEGNVDDASTSPS
jgi:hypothetical protein